MGDFGNGIAVAIEALQDDFDLVDVFWCAALEAARLYGVVDAGVRRHGGQAQGGAEADAVNSHLVHAIFYRGEAVRRCVSRSIHFVRQLLHQHLQLVKLGVAGCNITKQWRLVSKVELDQNQSLGFTVNGLQQLLALMPPFELGDSSLLGNILQLTLGFFELRLEAEGIALPVGHGGVVVRL
jgi:hypothetical protein